MVDSPVRPRYPLDDSWLVSDPMNLALDGEPPALRARCNATRACDPSSENERIGISPGQAGRSRVAACFTIRTAMYAIVALAGAIGLFCGTDTRLQRSDVSSTAAAVAAVNCPGRSGSDDSLRTL